MELLCGVTVSPDGSTKPVAEASGRGAREATRPRIVVSMTVDKLCGRDPAAMATQIGLGLIPDSVLADYAAHAEIVAALFDTSGEQLWQSRLKRHATGSQRIALVIRDRGCVLCGASHTECEAHHVMPWHTAGKGRTDIDQLALLFDQHPEFRPVLGVGQIRVAPDCACGGTRRIQQDGVIGACHFAGVFDDGFGL